MGNVFSRPLHTVDLAYQFISAALGVSNIDDAGNAAQSVMKAEKLLEEMDLQQTLTHKENRHPRHKTDNDRKYLRRRIVEELFSLGRLGNDDEISLGNGGARPLTEVKNEKQAYIITGLPASGKSGVSSAVADNFGAYVIDSDYAKRKFPEFPQEYGASIVHEESSLVTFGKPGYEDELNLYEACVAAGANMVIPKIGHNRSSVEMLRDNLIASGYRVHLTLVSLDRKESCKRALARYLRTQRYVPLGLVFDGYANDPILTYYRLKSSGSWQSTGKISTNVPVDHKPEFIESSSDQNPAFLYR